MREQSAWLLPATPRARREDTVGAERRGPAAAATAATSERRSCPRASERSPQPRPPLLTPPPALGPPQQFAGSAATKGAGSRSPELVRSARSQGRRRARAPAAAGGDALPALRPVPDPRSPPDPPKGPAVPARPGAERFPSPRTWWPRCPAGLDG